jgi:Domain of unknown function (DUF5103)
MRRYWLVLQLIATASMAQLRQIPAYTDAVYEATIKTVAVYPTPNNPNDPARFLLPPVTNQNDAVPLVAEFDDLSAKYRTFRYKIFHCNADWTPSALSEIEFTYEYNDFQINDYQASFNTKIPYYHYRFELPKLKLSGNYVLAVYEDKRPAKLIFTRRFMLYQPRVGVFSQVRLSTGIQEQRTHQQVEFEIDYKGYEVLSPQEDFKVVLRQNFRWDKIITGLRASNVRSFDQKAEFRPFDLSNNFLGGNEFRWFDTRMARAAGISVREVRQLADQNMAYLQEDQPRRGTGVFIQAQDYNGQYVVLNRDTDNSTNEADYTNVVFSLKMNELSDAQLYVNGGFNLWQTNDTNRLTYNPALGAYEASIFVKQGIANYNYVAVVDGKKDESGLEGDFSGTTNDYEIFVYHRPPGARADQLVGYRLVEFGR